MGSFLEVRPYDTAFLPGCKGTLKLYLNTVFEGETERVLLGLLFSL